MDGFITEIVAVFVVPPAGADFATPTDAPTCSVPFLTRFFLMKLKVYFAWSPYSFFACFNAREDVEVQQLLPSIMQLVAVLFDDSSLEVTKSVIG